MPLATPLRSDDALIVVDIQNDFLAGGALAVPHADEIVPILNEYIERFTRRHRPVFVTRDWHPENHCSFHAQSGPWPRHCVMHTRGAEFAATLHIPPRAVTISKGTDPGHEAYSDFAGTQLEALLRAAGVRRVFVGGIATDYCVLHSVRDALQRGFQVCLLRDAIRAVDVSAGDGAKAEAEMERLGAVPITLASLDPVNAATSPLLTDRYELTMLRGYFASGMEEVAVFEMFVRRLPSEWNFLVAAGLEQALDFLETARFSPADVDWLETIGFEPDVTRRLAGIRFTGDVHAMPEGTIFFPDEPILRVTAPLPEAQWVETRLLNLIHFQTLIASKAARCVLAAPDRTLVEFGARRAHGAEASVLAARACYLAGFASTSNLLAGQRFDLPVAGTMAHSFVQAFDSEEQAFRHFARANRDHVVLLLDTYDTEAAARKVVALAPGLKAEGIVVHGVRLDSGDLAAHAEQVRRILDAGGLADVTVFASGNIDEYELRRLVAAPIDAFGVGTRIVTAADASYLDCAYKLQEYAGRPRCKHSEGKATWPGAKQVYRHLDRDGHMAFDVIARASETRVGSPLLECVMHHGRRTAESPPLRAVAQRTRQQIAQLPAALRTCDAAERYPVVMSQPLQALARELGLIATEARTGAKAAPFGPHHLGFLSRIYTDAGPVLAGDDESERGRPA